MKKVKDFMVYLQNHRGETNLIGTEYSIQVYDNDSMQANIRKRNVDVLGGSNCAFAKFEERKKRRLSLFLNVVENGIPTEEINYGPVCVLEEGDDFSQLFKVFGDHPDFEPLMIALMQLQL